MVERSSYCDGSYSWGGGVTIGRKTEKGNSGQELF